ncbi:MAG: hypothetical protein MK116_05520 [Phycisphaerales bacterium]|nr:hypothetical protein [Phycisphaerales bacterium]
MPPTEHTFEEAVTLITERAYDDASPVEELLPRIAWKAFAFGLDVRLSDSGTRITQPPGKAMTDLETALDHFHEILIAEECQEALARAAQDRNVTKLAAAIQLHVARYVTDRAVTIMDIDAHRLEHAVGLASFCLCSSLRLVDVDGPLAEIYWHEVSTARGDCLHSG